MRFALVVVLLLLSLPARAAAPESYTVLVGGNPVGQLKVTPDGERTRIAFDYKDNGRGPTITEELRLDGNGMPSSWRIRGSTTFGSKIDEEFELNGRQARWRDSLGEGSSRIDRPSLYIAQGASPWALGVYARALLGAEGGVLPTLFGGEARVQASDFVEAGEGERRVRLRFHAISGLDLSPSYFLLDDRGDFFAEVSPLFAVIRSGYEADARRLGEHAEKLARARLERIQQQAAHRFAQPVRIRNVRLFEPALLKLSAAADVVFHGGRITSIDVAGSIPSADEMLIDGEGGTLLPGFYEMHGHLGPETAILNIAAGITSVRDMGNDNARLQRLVDDIAAGRMAGPRIHTSGYIEGRSPFNSNSGLLVDSEAEALQAVRWYAARGARQIKLYNSMRPDWNVAAIREAHRLGLRVAGHIPAFSSADAMIEAGYDELTHINQIMLGWVLEPTEDTRTLLRLTGLKRLANLDLGSPRVRRTMDAIVCRQLAVEPTIAIHENLLLNQNGATPPGAVDFIEQLPIGAQRLAKLAWTDMSAAGDREAYAAAWGKLLDTLRELHQRGVLLLPGTDLGGGFAYHRELQLFERIGLRPAEVLRRASLDMARYLGEDQALGSIERGKLADFFLIPGDPTVDLRETLKVRMVVKNGVVYFPEEIHPAFGIRPLAKKPVLTPAPAP